jgi:hypothetical protein
MTEEQAGEANGVLAYRLPLVYTYLSRLRGASGVAAFIGTEGLTLVVVLAFAYSKNALLVLLMEIGVWSLYEIGYFVNDLADPAEAARIPRSVHQVGILSFCACRLPMFVVATVIVAYVEGDVSALSYGVMCGLVLSALLLHSSAVVKRRQFANVLTFAILATYKYVPVLIPTLGWREGMRLVAALFFSLGLSRVIVYVWRKYGTPDLSRGAFRYDVAVQLGCLVAFAPIILLGLGSGDPGKLGGPAVVWSYCSVVALLRWVARRSREPLTGAAA